MTYIGTLLSSGLKNIRKVDSSGIIYDAKKTQYMFSPSNNTLHKITGQQDGKLLAEQSFDETIIKAFLKSIGSSTTNKTHEQVKSIVNEKVVIQPIVQPIQTQGEQKPIIFQSFTAEPQFEEIITEAERWAVATIAQPLIANGITVYNDNIPLEVVRPREYVVLSVDDTVTDIEFADNRNQREQSLCTFIIQGQGNTFNNFVVEIANFIHEILRDEREKGKVINITNTSFGLDEKTNILSRTITCQYIY